MKARLIVGPIWHGRYSLMVDGERSFLCAGEVIEGKEAESCLKAYPDDFIVATDDPIDATIIGAVTPGAYVSK